MKRKMTEQEFWKIKKYIKDNPLLSSIAIGHTFKRNYSTVCMINRSKDWQDYRRAVRKEPLSSEKVIKVNVTTPSEPTYALLSIFNRKKTSEQELREQSLNRLKQLLDEASDLIRYIK